MPHFHDVLFHKDVIYEVLAGGSSPAYAVWAIEAVGQAAQQVQLKSEVCSLVLLGEAASGLGEAAFDDFFLPFLANSQELLF